MGRFQTVLLAGIFAALVLIAGELFLFHVEIYALLHPASLPRSAAERAQRNERLQREQQDMSDDVDAMLSTLRRPKAPKSTPRTPSSSDAPARQ